ncbi:RHS repeat-associated core domain-containing protein [Pectobacterium jejuense]
MIRYPQAMIFLSAVACKHSTLTPDKSLGYRRVNQQGTLRWQAPKSTLWGQRQRSTEDTADPGLAFAGQYRDTESGLCYNRFRYYDPNGGCYVSPDPIGIAGERVIMGMFKILSAGLIRWGWLDVVLIKEN